MILLLVLGCKGDVPVEVAHRPHVVTNSVLASMRLTGGRRQVQGLHDDLLALGGVYTNLWQVQAGERAGAS